MLEKENLGAERLFKLALQIIGKYNHIYHLVLAHWYAKILLQLGPILTHFDRLRQQDYKLGEHLSQ